MINNDIYLLYMFSTGKSNKYSGHNLFLTIKTVLNIVYDIPAFSQTQTFYFSLFTENNYKQQRWSPLSLFKSKYGILLKMIATQYIIRLFIQ